MTSLHSYFQERLRSIQHKYERLIETPNKKVQDTYNGLFYRYKNPVLTAAHVPYFWKYDLNPDTNPFLIERIGINAAFNAGAIRLDGKYLMAVRVEGADRKSFSLLPKAQTE